MISRFPIGARVRSAFNGAKGFTGTVVGHEDGKLVICRSDKIMNYHDKRVRYAYSPNELNLLPIKVIFRAGRKYLLNDKLEVEAMEHACDSALLMLCSAGVYIATVFHEETIERLSEAYGITNVKNIKA